MTKRYSYLDSLNAGRERRPDNSYDDLNRALDSLESTFESLAGKRQSTEPPRRYEPEHRRDAAPPRRERDEWRERAPELTKSASRPGFDLGALARDIDRTRNQEDSLSAITRIAADLTALRRDLRGEMTHALSGQFDSLRKDIETLYRSAMQGRGDPAIASELQRISAAIAILADQRDDRTLNALLGEMDKLKLAMGEAARDSSLKEMGRRWEEFGGRFDHVEKQISDLPSRAALADLDERLAQIAHAVSALPGSLPISSLEDKVRTLAGAIDHFSRAQNNPAPRSIEAIEERLDEIARALVATSASISAPQYSPEPFERIEARISSLARQIDEFSTRAANNESPQAFADLAERLDMLNERAAAPQQAIDRLTDQIGRMAQMLNGVASGDSSDAIRSLEQRFESLAETMQHQQDAIERQGMGQFRSIEQRIEELVDRVSAVGQERNPSGHDPVIESRLAEFGQRLNDLNRGLDPDTMRSLVTRIDDISNRFDMARGPAQAIDPDLVRNLEAQLAGLSALLAQPDQGGALPDEVAIRLDRLESAVAVNRDSVLDAARLAAEEAIRLAPGNPNGPAILALADDLKTLDTLARRSDERNAKTFEAIHETLLKIVDRLVMLESAKPAEEPVRKVSIDPSPSLEHEPQSADMPLAPPPNRPASTRMTRTPAEAASEAAFAALEREPRNADTASPEKKSLLGGIAKALGGARKAKAEKAQPAAIVVAEGPHAAEPAIDTDLAHKPIEPGSGAPDLNAIMRRVREERKETAGGGDAGQSDFIAAARRHAQAAAAEAESLKKSAASPNAKAGSLIEAVSKRRKPIIMAIGAIVIALSGLQLGKMALSDSPKSNASIQKSAVEPTKPAEVAGSTAASAEKDEGASDAPAIAVRQAEPSPTEPQPAQAETAAKPAPLESPATPVAAMPDNAAPSVAAPAPEIAATDVNAPPAEAGPFALIEAAKAGDPKAWMEIGNRYTDGRAGKSDPAEASKWFELAAEQGLAPAQYRIGNLYEKGSGVARDVAKAKTWYQLAAEQGNASAMHNLAVLFATGAADAVDNEAAARWFLSAAELGVKDSQFNLGILAAKGIGMPQDLESSYKWFALAAKSGDKDAAAKRDEVAKALRPEQLEKARGATELWQPKPLDAKANGFEIPSTWSDGEGQTASVDMKKAIRNIQAILNKSGYDAGAADGVMGGKTKQAIAAYQKANGMAVTGEVDEALVRSLLEKK